MDELLWWSSREECWLDVGAVVFGVGEAVVKRGGKREKRSNKTTTTLQPLTWVVVKLMLSFSVPSHLTKAGVVPAPGLPLFALKQWQVSETTLRGLQGASFCGPSSWPRSQLSSLS